MAAAKEVLRVNLDTEEETTFAVQRLDHHFKTIHSFYFKNRKRNNNDSSSNESIIQKNFTRFLNAMDEKAQPNTRKSNSSKSFTFDALFVGIDDAKILAQIINASNPTHTTLKFDGEVSEDAFEYLLSKCGTKKITVDNNKRQQPQTTFEMSGRAIKHNHVTKLNQFLESASLDILILRNTRIGRDGVISLGNALYQSSNSLTTLNLSNNRIDALGTQTLAKVLYDDSCRLKSLDLSYNNQIGDDGVAALANSLPHNTSLQKLYLTNVRCRNKGLLALADGLAQNNSLECLCLKHNRMDGNALEGIQALGRSLKSNSTLVNLNMMNILAEGIYGFLISSFVNSLDGKTSKLRVDLSYNIQISQTDMNDLVNCCNAPIISLDLEANNLQPYHIEAITRGIREQTFNIETLSVDFARADDDSITNFFDALVENKDSCSLIALSLECVKQVTSIGAQHIVGNIQSTKLQQLFLTQIPIGNEGVQQIACYLNDTELTKLGLGRVGMEDSGLIALSDTLRSNTKLTYLDLHENNQVSEIGKIALLETLRDYNMTLNQIRTIQTEDKPFENEIQFYPKLNKANRAKFCDPDCVAVGLFPFIFEIHSSNPSIIFWILQACPHVIIYSK